MAKIEISNASDRDLLIQLAQSVNSIDYTLNSIADSTRAHDIAIAAHTEIIKSNKDRIEATEKALLKLPRINSLPGSNRMVITMGGGLAISGGLIATLMTELTKRLLGG